MPEISEEELAALKSKASSAEEKAKALESTNKRLLDESTDFKSKYQDSKAALDEAEKARLEKDGNLSELLNKANDEIKVLQDDNAAKTSKVFREKLKSEVSKHAKDAHDVDMILKVAEHRDLLKLDETNLTVEGTKEFVDKCRETHNFLFSKKTLDPGDNNPPKKGADENLTDDQNYLADLKGCSTKIELDAVKKKYGKPIGY